MAVFGAPLLSPLFVALFFGAVSTLFLGSLLAIYVFRTREELSNSRNLVQISRDGGISLSFCFRQILPATFDFVFFFVDVVYLLNATPITGFWVGVCSLSVSCIPIVYFLLVSERNLNESWVDGRTSMHFGIAVLLILLSPELVVLLPWIHSDESYFYVGYHSSKQMFLSLACSVLRGLLSIIANMLVPMTTLGIIAISMDLVMFMFTFAEFMTSLARYELYTDGILVTGCKVEITVRLSMGVRFYLVMADLSGSLDKMTEPGIKRFSKWIRERRANRGILVCDFDIIDMPDPLVLGGVVS
jgi:hypothetical protein